MPNERKVFFIGLNMAGAVSAGAYTAGVLDFLIDALDTLYGKRAEQQAKYGDDYSRWEIPAHEIRLVVMSGASAGGMVSAICAASLCEHFDPIRNPDSTKSNRLYKSWVDDIDISYLLGGEDLKDKHAPVVSLLDSTQIDRIASDAIRVTNPLPNKRAYVADALKLVLTVTNLGGIPYATESDAGNAETQTLYHSDQASFEVRWDGGKAVGGALPLSPHSTNNWPALADAAKATGAFPVALAPRILNRTTGTYNQRQWRVSNSNPQGDGQQGGAGDCNCSSLQPMQPNWDYKDRDDVLFQTLNVDGGVTNNDPFECAHQELTLQLPSPPAGHNPRSALHVDRAVVSIAPFLATPDVDVLQPLSPGLFSVLGNLVNTIITQSRIQGENIILTKQPDVFSRWAISPSSGDPAQKALASACLGAFGGFLSKAFRAHDYQLGRRNCQRFLQTHFALPLDNVVTGQYSPDKDRLKAFITPFDDGTTGISIIPVVDDLATEIPLADVQIGAGDLQPIADAATTRLKLVASQLLANADFVKRLGFDALWTLVHGDLKQGILNKLTAELSSQKLLK